MSWEHFANTENPDEGGWGDLVASLEKRYASDSQIAKGNNTHQQPFESHPIIPSIDNIIRQLPSMDDYPLWRIRCKVTLQLHLSTYLTYSLSSQA